MPNFTPEQIASVTFVVTLLLGALAANAKGWWYPKSTVDKMEAVFAIRLAEKDTLIAEEKATSRRWEDIAMKALNVGEKAVEVKEKS